MEIINRHNIHNKFFFLFDICSLYTLFHEKSISLEYKTTDFDYRKL